MTMKKFERKLGSGAMFTNIKKENDTQPDLTGVILTPDGKEYKIAGWKKEGKKGKYLSLSIKEKSQSQDDFII